MRDISEDVAEIVDEYHMDESTITYECIEKYLDALNNDTRLRPVVSDEKLIDEALVCFETDTNKSKNLVNEYLCTVIKPQPRRRSARNS